MAARKKIVDYDLPVAAEEEAEEPLSPAARLKMANCDLPVVAEEEKKEPLSPTARMFHQPGFDSYIVVVIGLGRKINVNEFKAWVQSTLALHPRFCSILVTNDSGPKKLSWVRTKVVWGDHIVIPDMDPGSLTPDQLVENYLFSLSAATMDSSRPLWDFHFLNIRTTDAEATSIFRVHHSLGDGMSLVSLFLAGTRKFSDPDSLPSLPKAGHQAPGKNQSFRGFLQRLWAIFVLLWHTLVDMLLFTATATFLQDSDTPLKGTKGVEFRQKRIVHRIASLDDVKTIKNLMGCTVNDVLVGVTSAGLSRYLSRSFGERNDGKKDLPANIRIRTTLLVNIRQAPGIHALEEMTKGKGSGMRWGNCLGYMIMSIPILKCKDPLDYIRKGKMIAQRKKNSFEALFSSKFGLWIHKLFGIKVATALCHRVLSHTTLSFSNLIGPVEEVALNGHPMVYMAPSSYGHPQALALHFMSYMNKLTMVATVDELSIPNPHQLLEDLAESLNLIKNAAASFPADSLSIEVR